MYLLWPNDLLKTFPSIKIQLTLTLFFFNRCKVQVEDPLCEFLGTRRILDYGILTYA